MRMPKYDAFQLAQIAITGVAATGQTQAEWYFPDLPFLRPDKATIVAIETYPAGTLTNALIGANSILAVTGMKKASVTIYGQVPMRNEYGEIELDTDGTPIYMQDGGEFIQDVPLLRLNNMQNSVTDPFTWIPFQLNDAAVDFSKSFLNFQGGPGNTSDASVVFGIYYNYVRKRKKK